MSSSPFSCLVMNKKMSWTQDREMLKHVTEGIVSEDDFSLLFS